MKKKNVKIPLSKIIREAGKAVDENGKSFHLGKQKRYIHQELYKIIEPVVNEIFDTASIAMQQEYRFAVENLYETVIEAYYQYRTKMYNRHGEGVGTQTGWHLYYGLHLNVPTFSDDLDIGYEMSGKYLPERYYSVLGKKRGKPYSKIKVYDNMLKGIRPFIQRGDPDAENEADRKLRIIWNEFSLTVTPVVLKQSFSGTPNQIFDQAEGAIINHCKNVFGDEIDKAIGNIKFDVR